MTDHEVAPFWDSKTNTSCWPDPVDSQIAHDEGADITDGATDDEK